ncbi:unnamed protein product [Leptidea sinapis]|uniref:Uncharacterized protein n=1 Tax=Leptidea sinapis TaxID=189913 RepID=A0A5E4PWA7_9NEOP|nr:unnamed protein product [Leptidea sinapis]
MSGFKPIESLQVVDSLGISKTVFSHVSNLHHLLVDWERYRKNGTKICEAIAALKLHECTDDYFPRQTDPLIKSLLESCLALQNIVDGINIIKLQVDSLAILQKSEQAVICTWSMSMIAETISKVYDILENEICLKNTIAEYCTLQR